MKWVACGLALAVAAFLWFCFVVQCFWGWFVVPLGVPEIGFAHTVGLVLLVRLLRRSKPAEDKPVVDLAKRAITEVISHSVALLMILGVGSLLAA